MLLLFKISPLFFFFFNPSFLLVFECYLHFPNFLPFLLFVLIMLPQDVNLISKDSGQGNPGEITAFNSTSPV